MMNGGTQKNEFRLAALTDDRFLSEMP